MIKSVCIETQQTTNLRCNKEYTVNIMYFNFGDNCLWNDKELTNIK